MKRLFDFTASFCSILALSPLFFVVSILIKISSNGPVLYKQARTGLNGKIFYIYKFRSMKIHDESIYLQTQKNDSRITSIGSFIRRTSIDELPQLINIIRGEMSIVGPRPHAIQIDEKYKKKFPNYFDRYSVRPGLTGLAQISGYRGGDDYEHMNLRTIKDLEYIKERNFMYDLKIIILTIPSLFKKDIY